MYKVKNLTNSPYKIQTADGGFERLAARGEAEIDIHPRMVTGYSNLGYVQVTKIEGKAKSVKLAEKEAEPVEVAEQEDVHAEVAEANEQRSEDDEKSVLIAELKELGVKADKRSSVEKLQEKLDEALAK